MKQLPLKERKRLVLLTATSKLKRSCWKAWSHRMGIDHMLEQIRMINFAARLDRQCREIK